MLAYDLITIAFRYPECGHEGAARRIEQRFHLIGTAALDEVELDERHGGLPNRFRWFRPDTPECDAAPPRMVMTENDAVSAAQDGNGPPVCSRTMKSAYQSDQFSSCAPIRFS
jgi:hypothetical protein